jgi:hypothetical protein
MSKSIREKLASLTGRVRTKGAEKFERFRDGLWQYDDKLGELTDAKDLIKGVRTRHSHR